MMTSIPQFNGLRPTVSVAPVRSLVSYRRRRRRTRRLSYSEWSEKAEMCLILQVAVQPLRRRGGGGALSARCGDFIGSPTNLVITLSIFPLLFFFFSSHYSVILLFKLFIVVWIIVKYLNVVTEDQSFQKEKREINWGGKIGSKRI